MPTLVTPEVGAFCESQFDAEEGLLIKLGLEVTETRRSDLVRDGLAVPSELEAVGLVDTGSTGVAMDYGYAERLGLRPRDYAPYNMAGTVKYAPAVFVRMTVLMEPVSFVLECQKCAVFMNLANASFGLLVGMEILQHFLFQMVGPDKRWTLAIPGIAPRRSSDEELRAEGAAHYDPTTDCFRRWSGGELLVYRRKRRLLDRLLRRD